MKTFILENVEISITDGTNQPVERVVCVRTLMTSSSISLIHIESTYPPTH